MENCYVYVHRKKETKELFYVGISVYKNGFHRAFSNKKRNDHWLNIEKKYGVSVEIIKINLTWVDACRYEIGFIKEFGRIDLKTGILCNQTNGGDGAYGRIASDKLKQTTRLRGLGNKYALGIKFDRPEETKKRMRKPKSEDHRNNISKAKMGLKLSEESRLLRRLKMKNKQYL